MASKDQTPSRYKKPKKRRGSPPNSSREKAAAGLKVAVGRVEEQREDFAGYLPGELKKLDNAVAEQYGRYVIFCVSGDDSARELIAKYAG